MRTKEEILHDSLGIWQSYYDQIEMTQEDKENLDRLDGEYSQVLKKERDGIKVEDDFGRHVILYAKGHYPRSKDAMDDLRSMLAKYANVRKAIIRPYDIYRITAGATALYGQRMTIANTLSKFFDPFYIRLGMEPVELSVEYLFEHMLSVLCNIPVMRGEQLIIDLGEADPNLNI